MAEGKVAFGYTNFEKRCEAVPFKKTNYGENVAQITVPENEVKSVVDFWIL